MRKSIFLLLALVVLLGAGCAVKEDDLVSNSSSNASSNVAVVTEPVQEKTYAFPGALPAEQIANKQVRITTAKGDIVFDLFADIAPMAVSNFVYLAGEGFYDSVIFHRREEGFVIQGGDPLGTGRGGPGYTFEDELADQYQYERGIVAMANRGANTNGSQFFIMLGNTPLPKNYTIFGRVTEGMDVVDTIEIGDEMTRVVVEGKE